MDRGALTWALTIPEAWHCCHQEQCRDHIGPGHDGETGLPNSDVCGTVVVDQGPWLYFVNRCMTHVTMRQSRGVEHESVSGVPSSIWASLYKKNKAYSLHSNNHTAPARQRHRLVAG